MSAHPGHLYEVFPLPIDTLEDERAAAEWDVEKARIFFSKFKRLIPARVNQLEQQVRLNSKYQRWTADYSRDSMLSLSECVVSMCFVTDDGLIDVSLDGQRHDPMPTPASASAINGLTVQSRSLIVDFGIYWGQALSYADPSSKWVRAVGKTVRCRNLPVISIPKHHVQYAPWINLNHWIIHVFQERASIRWPVEYFYDTHL